MSQLKKQLRVLPYDEIKEAVDYYEQYFSDAGEENERVVLAELGSTSAVASQIIASYVTKDTAKPAKHGLTTVWQIILAVFASPVALPMALAVVVLAVALVIVVIAVVFSIGATGVGLILGGIMSGVTSVSVFLQSFATAVFFFGLGLTAAGAGLAIIIGTVHLSKKCFHILAKYMGAFILRRNKK